MVLSDKFEIKIIISGTCKNLQEDKEGNYVAVIEYENNETRKQLCILGKDIHTTANRMCIKAVIESVKMLKKPCDINIITPTLLGFNSTKSPNTDLLFELKSLLCKGNHYFKEIVSSEFIKKIKPLITLYGNKLIDQQQIIIDKFDMNLSQKFL